MGPFKRFLANAALVLLGVFLAFLVLEVALRFHNPFQFRVRLEKLHLLTNITFRTENHDIKKLDTHIVHRKNSLGFRGDAPPADFSRRLTLIAIGGSTTECFYLSDGRTWVDALGRKLQGDFPRVWINNAGLDGQSTFGHLQLLRDYVIRLRPKCVLFLVGLNDLGREDLNTYDLGQEGLDLIKPRQTLMHRLARHSEAASLGMNLFRFLKSYQRGLNHREIVLTRLEQVNPQDRQSGEDADKAHWERYLESYRARLRTLIRLCRRHGIEPVLISQPALYGEGRDPVTQVDLAAIKIAGNASGKVQWQILELYNDVTREVGREEGVRVIDLAREMPKDSRYYYDFYHFTNQGSEKVGEIIHRDLAPWLAAKFPQDQAPGRN